MTTLTIPFTRSVTDAELHDLIFGTGALTWPWWGDALYTTADHSPEGEWVKVTFRAWDPDKEEGDFTAYERTPQQILDAVATCYPLIVANDEQASREILNPGDLGVLDALGADAVLQTAVYGEIVYG